MVANKNTLTPIQKWRKHTMGRCHLLHHVMQNRKSPELHASFADLAANMMKQKSHLQIFEPGNVVTSLAPLLERRVELIKALTSDGEVERAIEEYVKTIGEYWSYEKKAYVQQTDDEISKNIQGGCKPSFFPLSSESVDSSGLAAALESVAEKYGWTHPGVLMAGETLAIHCGVRREANLTVRSKIMFAASNRGVLADITLERIDGGCGLLIPDPLRCGYLLMDEDFSDGLQNAFWAARNYAKKQFATELYEFDWRWSIDLLSATSRFSELEQQVQIRMQGRSAEVVFACGLIASHKDNPDNVGGIDPIDPHIGATASIAFPGEVDRDELLPVGAIEDKTLVDRMESKRLVEVVIAKKQAESTLPPDKRYEFCRAETLAEAYEFMTRHPRITRGLNRYFRAWSKEHLDQQCTPWIMPEIKELKDPGGERGRLGEDVDLRSADGVELIEDINLLVTGRLEKGEPRDRDGLPKAERRKRWIGNRVRIFADSGMGKSMLMLHCQRRISHPLSQSLPLRIGRTTGEDAALSILWNEGDVIRKLAELPSVSRAFEAFAEETPEANQISIEDRIEWLRWMLRKGRVCFLIDALDQVATAVTGLGSFLASATVRQCPLIITGRWESYLNRGDAFRENAWRTLRIEPFDRDRQVRYLGEDLAAEILLEDDDSEIDWQTSADDLQRHQWKELVRVPLLLSLIQLLSTGGKSGKRLADIHNRFELYDEAVSELIDKGWKTATDDQKAQLRSGDEIRVLLGQISWYMVRSHNFSGVLEGDAYRTYETSLGERAKLLEALQQIDVTTAFQVLDRADARGLAFRHRSFMEFFAACHWMSTKPDSQRIDLDSGEPALVRRVNDAVHEKVLAEIHEIDDSQGTVSESRLKRLGDWQDTLRFALGHSHQEFRNQLANDLIEHGNPWVVYQAIKRDRIDFSRSIDSLCRWLVHRDSPIWFEYIDAISELSDRGTDQVEVEARSAISSLQIDLGKMSQRSIRDAAYLAPLTAIAAGHSLHVGVSAESNLKDQLTCLPSELGPWDFTTTLYRIEGGRFDVQQYHRDVDVKVVDIDAFELADFPVTNSMFELFVPSHRRQRDQYSHRDNDPVVHVSWYMATEFCFWLSALMGRQYRLPTEWEWEWATRWLDTRKEDYWWGPELDGELCWCSESLSRRGTRSRHQAIEAHQRVRHWHPSGSSADNPGLLDLSGNVWEWCENRGDLMALWRVLRGGCWFSIGWRCRSGYRLAGAPSIRNGYNGFRLAAVLEPSQASKQSVSAARGNVGSEGR